MQSDLDHSHCWPTLTKLKRGYKLSALKAATRLCSVEAAKKSKLSFGLGSTMKSCQG